MCDGNLYICCSVEDKEENVYMCDLLPELTE